jgi:hypothetical protein
MTPSPARNSTFTEKGGAARESTGGQGWSRTTINFCLDCLLMLLFVVLLGVTAIMRFAFPAPSLAAGWTLWGWSLDEWQDLQFVLVCILAVAILVHVMLHWNWICGVISSKVSKWKGCSYRMDEASKTPWGIALLILIINVLGILLAAAVIMIRSPGS